ncbi:MAG: GGDEF domain-containing protein [Rhodobacteraceae bacterium]|nr:GGDEF domain-containing protein [Paracoccaceae bacterium]
MSAGSLPGEARPALGRSALGALMPMHLWLDREGTIRGAGPTLCRMRSGMRLIGRPVFEVFEPRLPADARLPADLVSGAGGRVQLRFRAQPRTLLRGLAVPVTRPGGVFINLSPGISVAAAVADHALTLRDFAPSDPSVDLLYLIEAHAAILAESRSLNQRLAEARAEAEQMAATDPLTGLRNRRAFDTELAALLRRGEDFGLLHVDLDDFKQVNDTLGHAAGDEVLRHVAAVLAQETRGRDLAARVGGDEFMLLLRDCGQPEAVVPVAERILARLDPPLRLGRSEWRVTASIGGTHTLHYTRPEPDKLLRDADHALYASKHAGRARHTLFVPDRDTAQSGSANDRRGKGASLPAPRLQSTLP